MTEDDLPRAPGRVRAVYDEIAPHFSKTREYPWPEIEDFLGRVDGGDVGLDVGCGNGRHVDPLAEITDRVLALDASRGVLDEARKRLETAGIQAVLFQGDAAALPLADGSVDVALSIATIHHLPDRETRVESLRELRRVLAPEGSALVSAWSTAHDRFDTDPDDSEGFDTTLDWTLPDGETLGRFYHVYAPAEFDADLNAAGLTVDDSYVSSGNCYAEVRR
jgi:ubiquinone/menaquinone biosynthesis C-methylase UbiE